MIVQILLFLIITVRMHVIEVYIGPPGPVKLRLAAFMPG